MCAGAPAASRSSMARRRWFSPSANIRSRSELGSTAIVPPRDDAHSSGLEDRPKGPSCQQMFAERTACSVGPAFGTTERQLANRVHARQSATAGPLLQRCVRRIIRKQQG